MLAKTLETVVTTKLDGWVEAGETEEAIKTRVMTILKNDGQDMFDTWRQRVHMFVTKLKDDRIASALEDGAPEHKFKEAQRLNKAEDLDWEASAYTTLKH